MAFKRVSIVAAVGANALVLLLPGSMIAWQVLRELSAPGSVGYGMAAVVSIVAGIPFLAVGSINLLCVRGAHVWRGDKQRRAIRLGLVSCVVLGLIGLLMTALSDSFFPVLILGGVGYLTAGALCQPRAEPRPAYLCPICDYDLRGLSGSICPECGVDMAKRRVKPRP